jgi:diadenosine tetraphosphate (Ap4A) HIT family hydrolase
MSFPKNRWEAGRPAGPRVWQLDRQLRDDTIAIGDLPLCRVLLNNDGNYPWLILVPRREDLVELTDLNESGRTTLMGEIAQVSTVLKAHTRCHKLNVAALGNVVAQLHVHIIARFRTDPAWPNPVWGKVKRIAHEKEQRDLLVNAMRSALQIGALQG